MQWSSLNLLVLGYGLSAAIAVPTALLGFGVIAGFVIFWLGGAILTVSISAIKLIRAPLVRRTHRHTATNVISLDAAMLRSTMTDRSRG